VLDVHFGNEYFTREPSVSAPPQEPRDRPELDSIVETIIYLYTESRRLTKDMASGFGLTGPQLTILKLLESFQDLSLSTLSERIRAQNSTVTGIVDRMEREGLVRRERSKTDRRVVHLRLSEKGAKLAREIQVEPMEIFRSALLSLSPSDLRDLLRILTKLQRQVLARVSGVAQEQGAEEPAPPSTPAGGPRARVPPPTGAGTARSRAPQSSAKGGGKGAASNRGRER
jgi:DNA-binding MarR family transcriptional regulator